MEETKDLARKLFLGDCTFMLGVAELGQLPPATLPEIAFIGRSNVGKSSLLNALTGRNSGGRALARVSNTPGRTQQLNYFNLGDQVHLVDLPGYGYAEAPKAEVERWQKLIKQFMRGRVTLRRVFLLVDSRHGFKNTDEDFMKILDAAAVTTEIVLTKIDLVKPAALEAIRAQVQGAIKKHPAAFPEFQAVSSEKGTGIEDLRTHIYGVVQ